MTPCDHSKESARLISGALSSRGSGDLGPGILGDFRRDFGDFEPPGPAARPTIASTPVLAAGAGSGQLPSPPAPAAVYVGAPVLAVYVVLAAAVPAGGAHR